MKRLLAALALGFPLALAAADRPTEPLPLWPGAAPEGARCLTGK